jgi:hypothetical protein
MSNFIVPSQIVLQSTANVAVNGIKTLIYGEAGAGKTTILATAPAPVIFSAESGLLSLRRYNLPFIEIKTYAQLNDAYNWAMQSAEARQFWTLGIDSISEIAEVILQNERERAGKDPRKAYGEMAMQVMQLLRQFRDMPGRNVVFNAKMSRVKDDFTGMIKWGPMMPGQQVDQQLPYFTDEVFHLGAYPDGKGGIMRALRTQPDNQFQAKDRSGCLALWEEPNLSMIFDKIMRG